MENKMFLTLEKKETREDEQTIVVWANRSDVVDRSGHVIDDKAWQLDRFKSNPVICAFHRYDRPPVAKALWTKVVPGKGLMMKIKFASTPEGQEFYTLYKENILNAFSVGFYGREYEDADEMDQKELSQYVRNGIVPNRVYKQVELFEVSCVAVPDNYASLVAKSETLKTDFVKKGVQEFIEVIASKNSEEDDIEEKAEVVGFVDLETNEKTFIEEEDEYKEEIKSEEELIITEDIETKENEIDDIIGKALEEVEEEKSIENEDNSVESTIKMLNKLKEDSKAFVKEFKIEDFKTEQASFEYKIFTKYIQCKTKNLFINDLYIPSIMKGNYLSALDDVLKDFELVDQRNFGCWGGEKPLRYKVVQINSKKSGNFLIDGTSFYKNGDSKFIVQIYPVYGGINVDVVTNSSESEFNRGLIKQIIEATEKNNVLKNEKFSISGEFLDTEDISLKDIVFPEKDIEDKINKNVKNLDKNKSSRGIMLIGPPGTGKTRTGKALMSDVDSTFIWISSKDFRHMSAVSALSLSFELARKLAPTILFIEDIDTWLKSYSVDLLKTEMDGIRENKGVLTLLTSNFPESIPDALIDRPGRFHHILNMSLPNEENRFELLKKWIKDADKDILRGFAEKTNGFSGSHLKELVDFAKMISEDDEISIEESLEKSLEQMKKQKELISSFKEPKEEIKEISEEIEQKDGIVVFEDSPSEEIQIEFEVDDFKKVLSEQLIEVVKDKYDGNKLVEERLKRFKGEIF